jgi:N6-adenosine-specific RNA methylase IME4
MRTPEDFPYLLLSLPQIEALPVAPIAEDVAHLWLWTTDRLLPQALHTMDAWGFTYFHSVTWVKPSGAGVFFVVRNQHLLMGYRGKLKFRRYCLPNVYHAPTRPGRHSQKPEYFYDLIEQISPPPYLELFARNRREGWHAWGNEVESDIDLQVQPCEA